MDNQSIKEVSNPEITRVAALAGRRPDALDADTIRFPLSKVTKVREDIKNVFDIQRVTHLVCSAACGADLVALEVANRLGIEIHIILPFLPAEFRKISVDDRPGEWGKFYDEIIEQVNAQGRLHLLNYCSTDGNAFSKATQVIVNEAVLLARGSKALAVAVWEGHSRGDGDATQEFIELSEKAGLYKIEVSTL